MRIALVYNPNSGEGTHDRDSLVGLLEEAGHVVSDASVEDDRWKELLTEPADLVVVAGGDGTIRKVFKEAPGSGAAVSVLPLGSANNVARTLGLADGDVGALIAGFGSGARGRYDLGRARAPWGETTFVESIGGGIFAELLRRAEHVEADGEEKLELGLRLLKGLVEEAPALEWGIEIDGRDASGAYLAVEVMNIRETGPNIPMAPEASTGDGRFDVVPIRPEDRPPLLDYLEARRRDEQPGGPELTAIRGAHVVLRPPPGSRLRVDDQLWPEDDDEASAGGEIVVSPAEEPLRIVLPG